MRARLVIGAVWLLTAVVTNIASSARVVLAQDQADRAISQSDGLDEAVMAAAEPSEDETRASRSPERIIIGAYINDIQELDFRTHSYVVDLYVWFRWMRSDLDPSKSMEFMNRYQPTDHQRDLAYDEPQTMPDGSRYAVLRNQGRFSTKLVLEQYPFDRQELTIILEDSTGGTATQHYVADKIPIALNPSISIPGFRIGTPRLDIVDNQYPTNFGDLTVAEQETYSRAILVVPIARPITAIAIKTFLPILLIIMCASLVLLMRPQYVDARVGLSITALLTLVALQLTGGSALPKIDYLTLVDKVFLASYAFIMLVLARVVHATWRGDAVNDERRMVRIDRVWLFLIVLAYAATVGTILGITDYV